MNFDKWARQLADEMSKVVEQEDTLQSKPGDTTDIGNPGPVKTFPRYWGTKYNVTPEDMKISGGAKAGGTTFNELLNTPLTSVGDIYVTKNEDLVTTLTHLVSKGVVVEVKHIDSVCTTLLRVK